MQVTPNALPASVSARHRRRRRRHVWALAAWGALAAASPDDGGIVARGRRAVGRAVDRVVPPPHEALDLTKPLPDDLWRRTEWRRPPAHRPDRGPAIEWAMVGIVAAHNVLLNVVLPDAVHLPANIAVGALLIYLARRAGARWDHMGLRNDRVKRGLKVGLAAAAAIAAVVIAAVAIPAARDYFADDRFIGVTVGEMLFETLARIPIVTAAFEELVFRGVLLAVFLQRFSPLKAATLSAILFGFWHTIPGLDTLESNQVGDIAEGVVGAIGTIGAGVVVTGLAGYVFTWLRFRGNHLLAPILTHVATNSFAYAAGWLVVRRAWA